MTIDISKLNSVQFDGIYAINNADELLSYVELISEISDNEHDYCEILNKQYYYPDMITPLFDTFMAIELVEFNEVSEENQKIITRLEELREICKFRKGAGSITVDDILVEEEYDGIKYVYDMLGGIYELDEDLDDYQPIQSIQSIQ